MNFKKLLKYSLALILVAVEIYFLSNYIIETFNDKDQIKKICKTKCAYDDNSYFWEYSGEGAVRGFTTKEECFNHCSRREQGFAALMARFGTAFLSAFFQK